VISQPNSLVLHAEDVSLFNLEPPGFTLITFCKTIDSLAFEFSLLEAAAGVLTDKVFIWSVISVALMAVETCISLC